MTNAVRDYVRTRLSEVQRRQILKDYDNFENAGSIGNSVLRTVTEDVQHEIGRGAGSFGMWSQLVAFEVARAFAEERIAENRLLQEQGYLKT